LKHWDDKIEQERTILRLLVLREKIRSEIPVKTARDTLLLATWNIREFKDNRLPESYHYLAEIIDAFDFVAVQEVSTDLAGLVQVMNLLGGHWDYLVTDATEGSAGGRERMAFLYDKRKITFRNMAGEIVLPPHLKINEGAVQFARTPFLAAFQAGWFKFTICTVHIYYGSASLNSAGMQRRIAEISAIGNWLRRKAKRENTNYILLGDFNIEDPEHLTMKALEDTGFYIPEALRDKPTDLGRSKFYDQIAFRLAEGDMVRFRKDRPAAGAFDFSEVVMTPGDLRTYLPYFTEKVVGKTERQVRSYYEKTWRTLQLSDHLPLWVSLRIDFSDEYLRGLLRDH
jgi:endonuclease/exonuclease/phosphatase family metal-dependent hydrolase